MPPPGGDRRDLHELLSAIRCTSNGQTVEARFSLQIPFGRPDGFSPSEWLISETSCLQAIRDGRTHNDPITGNEPFTVSDMDDFWFANVAVTGPGLNSRLAPLFYVVNPSRYCDPARPDKLGRIVDLCYTDLAGGSYCDQARRTGQGIAWDDSRSPFKGGLREYQPGTFTVQDSGPTTIHTDVYGRNASGQFGVVPAGRHP